MEEILAAFGLPAATCQPFGSGLINTTWLVKNGAEQYILQRVNTQIFQHPELIAENIENISRYLQQHHPGYMFVKPVKTHQGSSLHFQEGEYYRVFPFVAGAHTYNVAQTPTLAYEAGKQFGMFTQKLTGFPIEQLKITLPDFHNLSLRYQQFITALQQGNAARIDQSADEIRYLQSLQNIVTTFEQIIRDHSFALRVTHHDTKISNVLFSPEAKGICVIDLDTVMPGYFISDIGDMLRTYLSPTSEEDADFEKIKIRTDYFTAILQGYLSEMHATLSEAEIESFVYAGKFMIYMQALRFLTDFINNDVYYGTSYPGQNFVRAGNQIVLLKLLIEKEEDLHQIITSAWQQN